MYALPSDISGTTGMIVACLVLLNGRIQALIKRESASREIDFSSR